MRRIIVAVVFGALSLTACLPIPTRVNPTPSTADPHAPPRICNGYVALTFDDGPTPPSAGLPNSVWSLVAALKRTGLRATFFNVGRAATRGWGGDRSDYLTLERTVGIVENHTWSHSNQATLADAQVTDALARTNTAIGQPAPKYFRPPYGSTTPAVEADAKALGLTQVIWTIDTFDYRRVPASAIAATVAKANDGDIVLMHDWSHAPEAIPAIAADLHRRGLCAGSIVPTAPTPLPPEVISNIRRAGFPSATTESVKAGPWSNGP